ncbi:reverse transcriptase family protein [Bacillus luti]|uniref:reverse transcriptase family protein n=1 Tax=Bacillus luti TaxID=2026191 RepID=UPI00289FBC6A|nr:reverse transcriptase family protein [Bacillus luti]
MRIANKINTNNSPIFLDEKHVRLTFDINEVEDINELLKKECNNYEFYKRSGKKREIWQPSEKIKVIQKWILKEILGNIPLADHAHGFVKNKSILTHANVHVHKDPFWIFSVDIKDFFPTIKIAQLKSIFASIGYGEDVCNILSAFCTIDERLVQGFPTSPYISNIVMKDIDNQLHEYAKSLDTRYSRYADDISFSGKDKNNNDILIENIQLKVQELLRNSGFVVNDRKTKLMKSNNPKKVTGLVVTSNGVTVPTKYKRNLSKEIYYCKKYGVESHLIHTGRITRANYKGYLFGMAGYVRMIENDIGNKFFEDLQSIYWD